MWKMASFNLENICRICTLKHYNKLHEIGEEIVEIGMKIIDCINYCVDFEVNWC